MKIRIANAGLSYWNHLRSGYKPLFRKKQLYSPVYCRILSVLLPRYPAPAGFFYFPSLPNYIDYLYSLPLLKPPSVGLHTLEFHFHHLNFLLCRFHLRHRWPRSFSSLTGFSSCWPLALPWSFRVVKRMATRPMAQKPRSCWLPT